MRKGIIVFLVSFFIVASTYAQTEKSDPNEWDFGKVKQGVILKHNFILKNQTNKVLKINSVNTSCGCTVSKADKNSLLPQESTTIGVTFNSHGYSGQIKQSIYVNTDDMNIAIIKFTIKVEVSK